MVARRRRASRYARVGPYTHVLQRSPDAGARARRALAVVAAALYLTLGGSAGAQHVEVSVLAGTLAYTPVRETDLASEGGGASVTAGVRVGDRWFWGGDVTSVGFRVAEGEPFYTSRTSALVALGEVGRRAAFARRVDAVVSGGAGFVRTRSRLLSQTFVARDPVLHVGGGLDLRVMGRLFVATDVRYLRTFGFPTDASRSDIDSTQLPWPSTHQLRAGLGARIRW